MFAGINGGKWVLMQYSIAAALKRQEFQINGHGMRIHQDAADYLKIYLMANDFCEKGGVKCMPPFSFK